MKNATRIVLLALPLSALAANQPTAQNSKPRPAPTTRPAATATPPSTSNEPCCSYPEAGDLQKAIDELRRHLESSPNDDEARMRLGFTEFFRAIETLAQSLYREGLHDPSQMLHMPIPRNSKPHKTSYQDTRRIIEDFLTRLHAADATLAAIKDDDVTLRMNIDAIAIDLDADGHAASTERLSVIVAPQLLGPTHQIIVRFDRTDVHWLRGYCHLLSATCEMVLAHDWREFFEHAGHVFFDNIDTPYVFLQDASLGRWDYTDFSDVLAAAHLLRFPVVEPERLKSALAHLKETVAQSRIMWKQANLEQDNDHEWLPNSKQQSVIPMPITQTMNQEWLTMLDEVDAILDGRKLIPFWRDDPRGLNLHRVFTEPREFDVWLWAQGTAAVPYLEKGDITSPAVWNRFESAFGREMIWYLMWIN